MSLMRQVLHLGDCLDPLTGLAALPDRSVDHVITDPPFGEQIYDNMRTNARRADNGLHAQRASAGYEALTPEEVRTTTMHLARVARRWVIVFMDAETLHVWRTWLAWYGARHIRSGVFVKRNPMPQVSGDRPGQGFESIQISHVGDGGRVRWNAGGKAAVWLATTAQAEGQEIIHKTQKPLSLIESVVRDFTDPGETVLDPFAGSGTTLVACKRLGRSSVGWEKNAEHHAAATRRIEQAREQYVLSTRATTPEQIGLLAKEDEDAA